MELEPDDGEREAFFVTGLSFTGEATGAGAGGFLLVCDGGGGGRDRGGEGVLDLRLDLAMGCS